MIVNILSNSHKRMLEDTLAEEFRKLVERTLTVSQNRRVNLISDQFTGFFPVRDDLFLFEEVENYLGWDFGDFAGWLFVLSAPGSGAVPSLAHGVYVRLLSRLLLISINTLNPYPLHNIHLLRNTLPIIISLLPLPRQTVIYMLAVLGRSCDVAQAFFLLQIHFDCF